MACLNRAFGHHDGIGPGLQASAGRRRILLQALGAGALALGRGAHAAPAPPRRARALLMVAGDYGDVALDLPGVAQDLARAREMAQWLGAEDRVHVLLDRAMTLESVDAALIDLARQARADETAFVYYSGHGRQVDGERFGSRCSEGLVLPGGQLYLDQALMHHLQRAARVAGQVLMFSDACHAGGLVTKQFRSRQDPQPPQAVAKVYRGALRGAADAPPGQCGHVANKQAPVLRGTVVSARWLHVAAAAPDEAAWATPNGSQATRAWHAAFARARPSRRLDGLQLQAQAQAEIDRLPHRQRLVLSGSEDLAWALR